MGRGWAEEDKDHDQDVTWLSRAKKPSRKIRCGQQLENVPGFCKVFGKKGRETKEL